MKLKRIICSVLLISMLCSTTVMADEFNDTRILIDVSNLEFHGRADIDSVDESLSEVNVAENVNSPQTRAGISARYYWNYNTYPYSFDTQTWSTDTDIYDTYPSTNEAEYLNPKLTYILTNPTGPLSYSNAIREGYIREPYELQLYDFVSSGVYNNVLLMLDSDVDYDILEKSTLESVFGENSSSLIGGTVDHRTVGGRSKTIYNLQLAAGEYLIMFTVYVTTENNHYALYTGCPLPILQSTSVAGTHNGVVRWNGGGLNAQREVVCPSVSVTVPSGVDPGLFALKRVWFEDNSMGGSQDLYVSSVTYYYNSPTNSYYKILSSSGGYHGNLYDNSPSSGSVQGNYGTKFSVTWASNLAYVNAAYYANTLMHLDYFVPYGLYAGM